MLVSEGRHRCQCSMYIIRWHVCANVLCMRRPGPMQHSAGRGGRRWGQHSLEPKMPSPPSVCACACVCVSVPVCVRFVTAGWWIRTFRKHNWEATHATASLYAIRIVTHTNTELGTVGLHHTWRLGLHFGRKHTREHTLSCMLCRFMSSVYPTFTSSVRNTHKHTEAHNGWLFVLP